MLGSYVSHNGLNMLRNQRRPRGLAALWHMVLACAALTAPLSAQEPPAPLTVPFTNIPPFSFLSPDGERSGFSVELSEMIGAEIGVPIGYRPVSAVEELVAGQATGQTQMIAGILQLPPLTGSNVFSSPVATDTLKPTILSQNRADFARNGLTNRRIAVVPPASGSDHPILQDNTPVTFKTSQAAIMALLSETVDAVLIPPPVVYDLARETNLDGRIMFFGEPLEVSTRHIALHESRSALLDPINAAIATFEADGRLPELRRRYNIDVPASPPDVLTVGVTHLPPLTIIADDGTLSGFGIEATNGLAERADITINYEILELSDWVKGPSAVDMDMVSILVETPDRLAQMDFTYPIFKRSLAVIVQADDTQNITTLADLAGQRVGVIGGSVFEARATSVGTFDVSSFETNDAMIAAELAGEIDAMIFPAQVAKDALERTANSRNLKIVQMPRETIESGIALRFGLGSVRDKLNGVIPGYLVSEEYRALREKYFGEPVFWTKMRIYWSLGGLAAGLLLLSGFAIWQRHQQQKRMLEFQQQNLASEKAHAATLEQVIADLEVSNRALDEFAYIASHDLKEPLRGIGINANFLLREELPESARTRAARMAELTGRMEQLISDLLYFSRLGRSDAARVNVQPSLVIAEIRRDLAEWLSERGGSIVEIGSIPTLRAERFKVKTVLQNLIVNGIKYNDAAEKCIEIGFAPTIQVGGNTMKNAIYVKDNGIGISAQNHDKAFRIFSRLNKRGAFDSGDDTDVGTGSGLAFVRKIIEEHGGTVDFTSEAGAGTTFYFTLPIASPDQQKPPTLRAAL